MVDIVNSVLTKIKAAVLLVQSGARVSKPNQNAVTSFPYVTVYDLDTSQTSQTLDYKQRKFRCSFQIDIYMNGSTGEIISKQIRDAIVPVMEEEFHMTCITSKPTTNVTDTTIYRYTMVYACNIDQDTGRISS